MVTTSNPLQRGLRLALQRKMKQARLLTETELARTAIVFAPHPDDETLACGGTIARKVQCGARVQVVFLTDGSASHAAWMPAKQLANLRQNEALHACQALGVPREDIFFLNYPDGHLHEWQEQASARILDMIAEALPEEIFLPYRSEPPADHAAAYQIVRAALASPRLSRLPRPILNEYPVWYWYHWPWVSMRQGRRSDTLNVIRLSLRSLFGAQMVQQFTHAVSITETLAQKQAALAAHRSQSMALLPDCNWPTLAGVSRGEFLNCFLQEREFFYRHS